MRRLITPGRLVTAGVVLLAVVIGLWIIPSSDYVFLPDRAHPVAPYVHVQGGHVPRDGGGIYFVDVVVRKASWLEKLVGPWEDGADLYPASEVVTPGTTGSQQTQIDKNEMADSKQIAEAVALKALGKKVSFISTGARVVAIQPRAPAQGHLIPTDVITAVDGIRVRSHDDLTRAMSRKPAGSLVTFTVRRGNATKTIAVKTVPASGGSRRGIVGIYVEQAIQIRLPLRVSIDLTNVGGPSAGLAFALDIVEELGRDVDRGNKIAATGEIALDGSVGAIGGIKQKTIGAREAGVDAFLVPAGKNARDARHYAHGLRIIPVKSFQQALRVLATLPRKR